VVAVYKTIVFVDFENLRKINENLLTADTKLIIFCGATQDKPAFDFAKEQFNKPCTIEFIKPNVKGNNALDFCIVFYVGLNADRFKNSHIIIYSKDKKDYDPLIGHLKNIGMNIDRLEYKEPENKPSIQSVSVKKVYDAILKHFRVKQTQARPRKEDTLKTYLQKTVFNKYPAEIIEQAIELMLNNKIIEKTNANGGIKFNKDKL
jgi:hypothetical protein